MRYILYIFLSVILAGCASDSLWTRKEIQDWYVKNAHTLPDLSSQLRYRGTDDKYHYFLIRAKDSWKDIKVDKDEIHIKDVRPLGSFKDDGSLGYYAVNIRNGFDKVR